MSGELSSSDEYFLSKGLLLAIPPKQKDYFNFMIEFELLHRRTLHLSIDNWIKLKDIALSPFKLLNNNFKFKNNLSTEEISSLNALMRNKNIIIQKADKGNTVVITDKEKYIEGVKCAISDFNKFVQLNITPDKYLNFIINVEKNLNSFSETY